MFLPEVQSLSNVLDFDLNDIFVFCSRSKYTIEQILDHSYEERHQDDENICNWGWHDQI